ncbi:hypothetical protein CSUI_001941 [Cystoisospora suis]|uniref:Uncharacterized protein n=1 Tax=Cystoisospora suis TaxID=483139 RepID=A0A2C6L6K8_9APIC|nr:hypothetical protein CSUI_001941 [Cystoisospora suis]
MHRAPPHTPSGPEAGPSSDALTSPVARPASDQVPGPSLPVPTVSPRSEGAGVVCPQDLEPEQDQETRQVRSGSCAHDREPGALGKCEKCIPPCGDGADREAPGETVKTEPQLSLPEEVGTPAEQALVVHDTGERSWRSTDDSNESQLAERGDPDASVKGLAGVFCTAESAQCGSLTVPTARTLADGISDSDCGSRKSSGRRTPRVSQSMVPPAELTADEIIYLKLLFSRKQRTRSAREGMWTPSGICCECCKRQKAKNSLSEALQRDLLRELSRERPLPPDVLTVRG